MTAFDDVTREVKEQRFLESLEPNQGHSGDLGASEDELLERICDAIVEEGRYSLAWIGVASNEGGVEIVASSGRTDYLYEGIVSWWGSSESGMGPTGTALRTGATQVANDLTTQPLFGPWRDRARDFGLSSLISVPVQLGSRSAALAIYDAYAQAFDEVSVKGLETIAREIESGVAASISIRQRLAAVEESTAAANALKRAELSLSESEQWFRTLVAKSSDLIVVVDEQGSFTYTNPIVDKLFGYEKYSLIGRNIFDLIHPERPQSSPRAPTSTRSSPTAWNIPSSFAFCTSTGEWRFIEGVLTDCLNDQAVHGIVGNGRDVTDRTYLTRALQTLSEGNQVLVHAKDESELIADLCKAIVTVGDYPLAWVGYAQHDDAKRPCASSPRRAAPPSSTGMRVRLGRRRTRTRPDWRSDSHRRSAGRQQHAHDDDRARAARASARSTTCARCARFPLQLHGETFGMIAIYSEQLNYFGPNEVETLGELAAELAYGIERLRDRERLERNEQRHARSRRAIPPGLRAQHGAHALQRPRGPRHRGQRLLLSDGRLHPRRAHGARLQAVHLPRRRRHHRRDPRAPQLRADRPGALREAIPAQGRPHHRL